MWTSRLIILRSRETIQKIIKKINNFRYSLNHPLSYIVILTSVRHSTCLRISQDRCQFSDWIRAAETGTSLFSVTLSPLGFTSCLYNGCQGREVLQHNADVVLYGLFLPPPPHVFEIRYDNSTLPSTPELLKLAPQNKHASKTKQSYTFMQKQISHFHNIIVQFLKIYFNIIRRLLTL